MTKTEIHEAVKKVVVLAGGKNGVVRLEIAQEVVGGPEGSFKQVIQSLKRLDYCRVVSSNDNYEETVFVLVLTPEGREYAASLKIQESFKNWP